MGTGEPHIEYSDSADAETIAAQVEPGGSPTVDSEASTDPHRTRPPSGHASRKASVDPHATRPPSSAKQPRPELPPDPVEPEPDWRAHELLGRAFGPWVIEGLLGEGGWGAVFRAHHDSDPDRKAALKVPKLDDPVTRDERLARFKVEIESIRRIHAEGTSNHVVDLLGADPDAALPWLALELIEGTDLGRQLSRRRKFPLQEGLALGMGTLEGLIEAHRAGVVHRDLKPANVLKTYAGEVRLTDFGVARQVQTGETSVTVAGFGLTTTGQQIGSVHTMSPEAIDGKPVEAPGDLYSFGCLLYQLLAGRPPFRGGVVQIYNAHLNQTPVPLSEFAVGIPPALDDLVARLMAKDPTARPTATQAQRELKAILATLEQRAAESTPTSASAIALELRPDDEIDDERSSARYTVERELGRGGMGIVYEAQDQHGRPVALKVAGHGHANQEQARQQLIRDAENAIRVTKEQPHPTVAEVHSVGTAVVRKTPIVFLVSELVAGPSLGEVLQEAGPIDDRDALRLLTEVAEGLSAIHRAGLLHLDLSPGNILLDGLADAEDPLSALAQSRPKIVDFGISRDVHSTTERGVEGNPLYMSPEQCEGEAPTFASDIYMLGASFYHATTGRPPFGGEAIAVMSQHRSAAPRFADLESSLGGDLALVLHKCLFKDPEDRYPSVDALIGDLRRIGHTGFPRGELKAAWARERKRLDVSRRLAIWGPSILAVVALIAISVISWVSIDDAQIGGKFSSLESAIDLAPDAAAVEAHYDAAIALGLKYPDRTQEAAGLIPRLARRTTTLCDELHRAGRSACLSLDRGVRPADVRAVVQNLLREANALRQALGDAPDLRGQVATLQATNDARSIDVVVRELEDVDRLCALASEIQDRRWDAAGALCTPLLAEAPADPAASRTARRLCGVWQAATRKLEAAWSETEAQIDERRARDPAAASELLRTFQAEHGDHVRWEPTREAARRLAAELDAQGADQPEVVRRALADLKTLEQGLADVGFARAAPRPGAVPSDAERRRLAQALSLMDEFLSAHGERVPVQATQVRQDQALAADRWNAGAQLTWDALRARLEAPLEEPGQVVARREAIEAFARDHAPPAGVRMRLRDGDDADLGLAQLKQHALDDLDAAAGAVVDRRLTAAEQALERYRTGNDRALGEADGALGVARAFANPTDPSPRLQRVVDQVRELRLLHSERVEVVIDGEALHVDRHELRVRTYAAFLAAVEAYDGEDHRQAMGCPTNEPPDATHRPSRWQEQLDAPELPVVGVSWFDACACARWAGRRLLTPTEWRAAAGSSERADAWKAGATRKGWPGAGLLPVGAAGESSSSGVFDMAGNASEWTTDPGGAPRVAGPSVLHFDENVAPIFRSLQRRAIARPAEARFPDLGLRGVRQ